MQDLGQLRELATTTFSVPDGANFELIAPESPANTFRGKTREQYLALRDSLPSGLVLYDVIAKPRFVPNERVLESTYDLTGSDLRTDLSCPICMGILQHAVVVKNCLHRFCAECIEKCVRIGIRECPQCRMHIASRRSLRRDPLFDQFVHRLFPDVKAFEDKNAILLNEANKRLSVRLEEEQRVADVDSVNSRSVSPSPSHGSPWLRRGVYISSDGVMQYRNGYVSPSPVSESLFQSEQKITKADRRRKRREIEAQLRKIPTDGLLHFELIPDPDIAELVAIKSKNRFKTDGLCTVQQLVRFLSSLLGLDDEVSLKIYTKEHRFPFEPHASLAYVHHQSCGLSHQNIVLYYTTRAYGDPLGGTLKGMRGYVSPLVENELDATSGMPFPLGDSMAMGN
ncbi:zinc finger, C3HC4 type (RING finger) domain-containing protein [Cardiosporidium cionae]|uniref:Zinc finger, C3HC4 type (RING finger) domain-containing protein n=1 Tax=Cardiosporidium cionae TaxID=476202 RepID=A0ABQ7JCT6_9APIC|nr:zinc finger, C3HC4 type (RING finger) domain-containing protein [Cardiosporidium cionae]|eukprot:KAF8821763.1 zinc finger, C3HC4 type (RING finger) domain-containing protein [Cardiosporidium cionae]